MTTHFKRQRSRSAWPVAPEHIDTPAMAAALEWLASDRVGLACNQADVLCNVLTSIAAGGVNPAKVFRSKRGRLAMNALGALANGGGGGLAQSHIDALQDAYRSINAGANPSEYFGTKRGRSVQQGFTDADGVTAYVELQKRKLESQGIQRGALAQAIKDAVNEFDMKTYDPKGNEIGDPERQIKKDLNASKGIRDLTDQELAEILKQHRR